MTRRYAFGQPINEKMTPTAGRPAEPVTWTSKASGAFLAGIRVVLALWLSASQLSAQSIISDAQTAPGGSAAACTLSAGRPERVLLVVVADAQGARVPGARVTAACGTFTREGRTAADSTFTLPLPPGTYAVRVGRTGFDDFTRQVVITHDQDAALNVILTLGQITEAVTVRAVGQVVSRSTTATKTDMPLLETPQAVTVVTRERIEDIGAQGLQEALNYAAGVRSDAFGLDSRTDSVLIRGGYPDEYLDGMRQLFNWYTSTTRTDPYLLERIEVLRGPASMLYGQGSTAGVVNLVSKRPLVEAQRDIGVQFGSFNRKQVQADLTGPLSADGRWLYRLVALGRKSDMQVDHVRDDRALLAPSLTWRPSAATSMTAQLRWQQDRSGSTLQFFPWSGNALPNPNGQIPTNHFIGEPGFDRYDSERLTGGWLFEHRFDDRWAFRHNLRVVRNEVDYRTLYSDSFSSPGASFLDADQGVIGRYGWISDLKVRMLTADQHAEGRIRTGAVQHQVLLGVDAVHFRQAGESAFDSPAHLGGGVPPIDAYHPVYTGYTPPPLADDPTSTQRQLGLYFQDQMKVGAHWIAVVGARHDRARSSLEGSNTEHSRATTKRLGLMYAGSGGWSPYLSYSESFNPVAGTDFFGVRYKPLRGRQVEAGLKLQPVGRTYALSAALFDLREKNRLVSSDPTKPLVQARSTRTTGLELELVGRIGRYLDLSGHYNYIENDEQLDRVPKHQAAVWGTQRFAGDFSAGLGFRYFSEFKDGIAPAVPVVALMDAMLAWERSRWRYALNVSNLADKVYVTTCLPRGDCFYGGRRTISVSAGYRY